VLESVCQKCVCARLHACFCVYVCVCVCVCVLACVPPEDNDGAQDSRGYMCMYQMNVCMHDSVKNS
jgi:hypothetical protein